MHICSSLCKKYGCPMTSPCTASTADQPRRSPLDREIVIVEKEYGSATLYEIQHRMYRNQYINTTLPAQLPPEANATARPATAADFGVVSRRQNHEWGRKLRKKK